MARTAPRRKIFISYSHDSPAHAGRVLQFAKRLQGDLDSQADIALDQFARDPDIGWPAWCEAQLEQADRILIVVTPTYRRRYDGEEPPGVGLGATFEAALIRTRLYRQGLSNRMVRVVVFNQADVDHIPNRLFGHTHFSPLEPASYVRLLAWLREDEGLEPVPEGGAGGEATDSTRDAALLDRIRESLRLGDHGATAELCREVLHQRPDHRHAHIALALALLQGRTADHLSSADLQQVESHLRSAAENADVATAWAIWGIVRYDAYLAHNFAMGEPGLATILNQLERLGRQTVDQSFLASLRRSSAADRFFNLGGTTN